MKPFIIALAQFGRVTHFSPLPRDESLLTRPNPHFGANQMLAIGRKSRTLPERLMDIQLGSARWLV